jgi:hypothetical protein
VNARRLDNRRDRKNLTLADLDDALRAVSQVNGRIPEELSRSRERAALLHAINVAVNSRSFNKALRDPERLKRREASLDEVIGSTTAVLNAIQDAPLGTASSIAEHLTSLEANLLALRSIRAAARAARAKVRRQRKKSGEVQTDSDEEKLVPWLPQPQPFMVDGLRRAFERHFKQKAVIKKRDGEEPHGPFVEFVIVVTRAAGNELSPEAINEYRKLANRARLQGKN